MKGKERLIKEKEFLKFRLNENEHLNEKELLKFRMNGKNTWNSLWKDKNS